MIDELLVSATPYGVRTALIDDGEIVSFNVASTRTPSLLENIYLAAPARHGGAASFVSIGKAKNALLQDKGADAFVGNPIVQVTRAGWDGKAPRVNAHPALAGRYLVYFPLGTSSSVARRIESTEKHDHLRAVASSLVKAHGGGVTIRSAAQDSDEKLIRAEAHHLRQHWQEILAIAAEAEAPVLLAEGPGLAERLIRDILPPEAKIVVDDRNMRTQLSAYAAKCAPEFDCHIKLSDGALFERHDAAGAMARALQPEVQLDGGGRLTIELTRALTAIDIDCGVRSGTKQKALISASLEAAGVAAREIRRRNIAGLIVIDFPRLDGADTRQALMSEMRKQMKDDTVAHKLVGINKSGLMEITRRRGETPLLDALTETRPGGYTGRRPRLDALAFDIASESRLRVQAGARNITLLASPVLTGYLHQVHGETGNADYAALCTWLGAGFTVREDPERRREDWAIEA